MEWDACAVTDGWDDCLGSFVKPMGRMNGVSSPASPEGAEACEREGTGAAATFCPRVLLPSVELCGDDEKSVWAGECHMSLVLPPVPSPCDPCPPAVPACAPAPRPCSFGVGCWVSSVKWCTDFVTRSGASSSSVTASGRSSEGRIVRISRSPSPSPSVCDAPLVTLSPVMVRWNRRTDLEGGVTGCTVPKRGEGCWPEKSAEVGDAAEACALSAPWPAGSTAEALAVSVPVVLSWDAHVGPDAVP